MRVGNFESSKFHTSLPKRRRRQDTETWHSFHPRMYYPLAFSSSMKRLSRDFKNSSNTTQPPPTSIHINALHSRTLHLIVLVYLHPPHPPAIAAAASTSTTNMLGILYPWPFWIRGVQVECCAPRRAGSSRWPAPARRRRRVRVSASSEGATTWRRRCWWRWARTASSSATCACRLRSSCLTQSAGRRRCAGWCSAAK